MPQNPSRAEQATAAWTKLVADIHGANCDNSRMTLAQRYMNEWPQEAQRLWTRLGVTTEQVAGVNGRPGLQTTDTGAIIVAAAKLSYSNELQGVTGGILVDAAKDFCEQMGCTPSGQMPSARDMAAFARGN